MKSKKASESITILTDTVLPSETNSVNYMFGGELLSRMDRVAHISARRHCNQIVLTVAVNHVSFTTPIPLNSVVKIESKVSRAFKSSMEVIIDVFLENPEENTNIKANQGIYTFVAVDKKNNPLPVPELIPETEEEKERYKAALRRKQLSLILSGRLKPDQATELKSLFE